MSVPEDNSQTHPTEYVSEWIFLDPVIPLPISKHDGQHSTYVLSSESCMCKNNSNLGCESVKLKNPQTTFVYFLHK